MKEKKCVPCKAAAQALQKEALDPLLKQLHPEWACIEGHHLVREFPFKDFKGALAFANEIGKLSEEIGHHPEITLSWGKVIIKIWTHKVNGLTELDFALADKSEVLFQAHLS